MKPHVLFNIIFFSSLVCGCGGSSSERSHAESGLSSPPSVGSNAAINTSLNTSLTVNINGPRNNFIISRTQQGILVIDKSKLLATVDVSKASQLIFSDAQVNLNISQQAERLNSTQIQTLIELYIAFFNRVPDADGLDYWMRQMSAGQTIAQIADNFYQAGILTSEFTGYTKEMSNADFIRIIYKNVLGRTATTAPSDVEINYWANDIQSGRQTKASVIIAMLNSARTFANDPQYSWVTRLLDNKIKVGQYFALQQALSYSSLGDNITRGIGIIAAVSAEDISKAISLIGIDDPDFDASIRAPEPPRNINIVTMNGSANVSFEPPSNNGGAPVTSYLVSCNTDGSTISISAVSGPVSLNNLQIGKAYSCFMKSTNRFGDSPNSASIVVTSQPAINSPPFNGDIVLGSPTANSIRIKLFSATQSGYVSLSYGYASNDLSQSTITKRLELGSPLEFQLETLRANSQIFYSVNFQRDINTIAATSKPYDFRTARSEADSFSFTIQADSHLDENSNLAQYQRTLDNILLDRPDFHVDLGDTFMTEKHQSAFDPVVKMAANQEMVNARYIYERQHFGRITHSTPLFLANGNHEGELGWLYNNTANNIAVWASLARQKYFTNPIPGSFYTGDPDISIYSGQRASWYSWQWGNALFVVLDPFWNSKTQASKDGWNLTLGSTQYQWLVNTLSNSKAKYKFIFLHNLVGGLDGQMRGGIEAASFFEWGGKNSDGSYGFDIKRPGWGIPIHQLLVNNKVTAVFHGHDHVYVRQSLDGIIYQEVPQPSALNNTSGSNLAKEYHYDTGVIQSSSGHIRVTVSPQGVKGEYIRSWLPANETSTRKNRQIDDSWMITPVQ